MARVGPKRHEKKKEDMFKTLEYHKNVVIRLPRYICGAGIHVKGICTDLTCLTLNHGYARMCNEPVGSLSIIVQQDATLYSFYSLQTALNVSGDTFARHQERE
jgi:hypothetical protein